MGRFFLGVLVCLIVVPLALLLWLQFGKAPVAVADSPFPMEKLLTGIPLKARIHREMVKTPPIQADEATLTAGARVYNEKCSSCHGFHSRPSSLGTHLYPAAPALWDKQANSDVIGVSDDAPGQTYWKIANGIRLTGMPSYKRSLTDTQIWQVSLLLANANKALPPVAIELLSGQGSTPLVDAQEELKKSAAALK
jgi:mono/diheme cytochrome c family protein